MRTPAWRRDRAQVSTSSRGSHHDDAVTNEYRKFRSLISNTKTQFSAVHDHRDMFLAHRIHLDREKTPWVGFCIEARLLCGQSDEEIAAEACCPPGAVDLYEKLFFNVRDRLKAQDWVFNMVIVPSMAKSDAAALLAKDKDKDKKKEAWPYATSLPFYDGTLKFFSYYGGVDMLEFLRNGFREEDPPTPDKAWVDKFFANTVRRRSMAAAMTFNVNPFNAMELFGLHTRLIEVAAASKTGGSDMADDARTREIGDTLSRVRLAVGDVARRVAAESGVLLTATEPRDALLHRALRGEQKELAALVGKSALKERRDANA